MDELGFELNSADMEGAYFAGTKGVGDLIGDE